MCGVVGFSGIPSEGDRERFISLCYQSAIRGVHAFGIAWYQGGRLHSFKHTDYNKVIAAIPAPLPEKIIFHNRYCTSGNWRELENNQPIVTGGTAMVFNGTIDMGTKAEMEARTGYRLSTDNDGEIVLRDFLNGEPLKHLTNGQTFAGLILTGEGEMFALRNELRPLYVADIANGKWCSSTADIASRAKFDKNKFFEVEPLKLVRL